MTAPAGTVVVGVGNPYRRDDGVGPALVDRLAAVGPPGVALVTVRGDTTRLMDIWDGAWLAIVIDAARSGQRPPGSVRRGLVHPGPAHPGPVGPEGPVNRLAGTHGLDVIETLRIARSLDRCPPRLVLFTVEAADLDPGPGLSPAVLEALPRVVAAVLHELATG
jgi:hydrogenase maturation protease